MDLNAVFAVCYVTGCASQSIKRFVVVSVDGATRFAKFAAEIFQNAKNWPQSCAKYFVRLLLS